MRRRILIIEDDSDSLDLMTYLLTASDFAVLSATSGQAGLQRIREERPDIVLCDIQLPELDGYGVAKAVLADPVVRGVPLIAVTALAMVGDRDRVLATGFRGYLSKPIDPELFVRQVTAFLADVMDGPPSQGASGRGGEGDFHGIDSGR